MSPEQLAALPSMSDTLATFGGRLLEVPDGPDRGKMLSNIVKIVTMAWNLPLTEQHNPGEGAALRRKYDGMIRDTPDVARHALERLVERRLSEFGHDPRTATAEVAEHDGAYYIKAAGKVLAASAPKG